MDASLTQYLSSIPTELTPQQIQAAQATQGPVMLLAVPGSGKTTVLVARLGVLLHCCQVPREQILTMTYTQAAADDIYRRIDRLLGPESADRLEVRTINGVCYRVILRLQMLSRRSGFTLLTREREYVRIVTDIYRQVTGEFPGESEIKQIRTKITYVKNMMLTDEEIRDIDLDMPNFSAIYYKYIEQMRTRRYMDYDDQMVYAYRILQKFPDQLEYWQDRYRYLCVDEAQDTSKLQHKIIGLLAQKYRNLFMVGDEDQSIYGFRAAYPEALAEFEKTYPDAKVLYLEENFRSTGQIVRAADRFIRTNQFRHPKQMFTNRPDGAPIQVLEVRTRQEQYEKLLEVARSCEGQTAILFRDNENVIPLVDLLERNEIPFSMRSTDSAFFSHRIVRDITAMLQFSRAPDDSELFMEFYYKLNSHLSKTLALDACAIAEAGRMPILKAVEYVPSASDTVKDACRALHQQFTQMQADNSAQALDRINLLMGYGVYLRRVNMRASKLEILRALSIQEPDPMALLQRLKRLRRLIKDKVGVARDRRVILSTIHSSKGLEYESVYLMDVIDGVFPESVPLTDRFTEQELRAYEEEKRLFYVGVTRARNQLTVFRVANQNSTFCQTLCMPAPPKLAPEKHSGFSLLRRKDTALENEKEVYTEGAMVLHSTFGYGRVCLLENGILTVDFEKHGRKQLLFENIVRQKLCQVIT